MAGIGFFPLSPKVTRINPQVTNSYTDRMGKPISQQAWQALQGTRRAASPQGIREKMMSDFMAQRNAANAANEARYGEGKSELSTLRDRNQRRLTGAGATAMADARATGSRQIASTRQDMSRRGLGSSTIGQSVERGINESTSRAVGAIRESAAQTQSSADRADTNNLVNFIERRTDVGPNESAFLQAMQNLGASAGRSGGRSSVFSTRSRAGGRSRMGETSIRTLLDDQVERHARGRRRIGGSSIQGFKGAQNRSQEEIRKARGERRSLSGYGMNDFSPDRNATRVTKDGKPVKKLTKKDSMVDWFKQFYGGNYNF